MVRSHKASTTCCSEVEQEGKHRARDGRGISAVTGGWDIPSQEGQARALAPISASGHSPAHAPRSLQPLTPFSHGPRAEGGSIGGGSIGRASCLLILQASQPRQEPTPSYRLLLGHFTCIIRITWLLLGHHPRTLGSECLGSEPRVTRLVTGSPRLSASKASLNQDDTHLEVASETPSPPAPVTFL